MTTYRQRETAAALIVQRKDQTLARVDVERTAVRAGGGTQIRNITQQVSEPQLDWLFTLPLRVPAGVTRYLEINGVGTLDAPPSFGVAVDLERAALRVPVADAGDVDFEILAGGVVVETLTLAAGLLTFNAALTATVVDPLAPIAVRARRATGSGPTAFRRAQFSLLANES